MVERISRLLCAAELTLITQCQSNSWQHISVCLTLPFGYEMQLCCSGDIYSEIFGACVLALLCLSDLMFFPIQRMSYLEYCGVGNR